MRIPIQGLEGHFEFETTSEPVLKTRDHAHRLQYRSFLDGVYRADVQSELQSADSKYLEVPPGEQDVMLARRKIWRHMGLTDDRGGRWTPSPPSEATISPGRSLAARHVQVRVLIAQDAPFSEVFNGTANLRIT